jgi:hypothetical protein
VTELELQRRYAESMPIDDFATFTGSVLAPHGFELGNALAVVGVCRDELMFPVEEALHAVWGPAFDMSALGAMVFLGRSGLAAAAGHAPGVDGRRRFVHVVMPHIGLDVDGSVGYVRRDGQAEPSTACGALVALQRQLSAGALATHLDADDLEMSLLRSTLAPHLTERTGATTPDLVELTDRVRAVATAEIVRLSANLLAAQTTDVAVFSTTMIHGPLGDRVLLADAQRWIGACLLYTNTSPRDRG